MNKAVEKNNMTKNVKLALICATSAVLFSCSAQLDNLSKVGKAPALEGIEVPMEKDAYEPIEWEVEKNPQKKYSNSLWQQGSREFFKDLQSKQVGDIIKVKVSIKDKAEIDNSTSRSRNSADTANAPSIFGLENKILGALPGQADKSSLLSIGSTNSSTGTGKIDREEIVETEIAAMVTQILPNGNLVIHGDQEIRVNFEVRKVTVDGIIRQGDIAADNSIASSLIAEARISYGGRGHITSAQQPRIGNQIIDILSPF